MELTVIVIENGHVDTSSNLGRNASVFHIALIHLGKVFFQLSSLQQLVNVRLDWAFEPW